MCSSASVDCILERSAFKNSQSQTFSRIQTQAGTRRMSLPLLFILLACALTFSAAQMSCTGKCGAEYYRGYECQCDYSCLLYDECCKDYESQCTIKNSCKGRCGETFKRGRLCSCDPECVKYKQCCPDYKFSCDAEETISGPAITEPGKTNSCDNVNDYKPKEPILNKPDQPNVTPSAFREGDNSDALIPLITPTSYAQDDPSDDLYSQILPTLPDDSYPENGLEAGPTPDSTSGYGPSPSDLLENVSTDSTLLDIQDNSDLEFTTEAFTVFTPADESMQAEVNPSSLSPTSVETPTESTNARDPEIQSDPTSSSNPGPTGSQSSTAVPQLSNQPMPSLQTGPMPTDNTPELQTLAYFNETEVPTLDAEETDNTTNQSSSPATNPSTASATASDPTTAPVSTEPTQSSTSAPENSNSSPVSLVTTIPTSPTPTPITEATTPSLELDDIVTDFSDIPTVTPSLLPELQDPSTIDSLESGNFSERGDTPNSWTGLGPQNDALTTSGPSPTDADDVTPEQTTANPLKVTLTPTMPKASEPTSGPQDKPSPNTASPTKAILTKPTSKPNPKEPAKIPNIDNSRDYQADDNNDTNLCSGRPVSAVTTLRNGTMIVFRGHYFWSLDINMVAGPARGITNVWGVPSPVDTVFTRCNCQGKTYMFKGPLYWRFDNDVLDPGYPKPIEMGFDGLRGHITAALSVPQYNRRKESVYFFKRGGLVQKYAYQFGTSPICGRKVNYAIYTVRNRATRQAVSVLEPAINIRTSWRGFPSSITAAVSLPSRSSPEGYKYYVFSRSKFYNIRMDGEHPVVATPRANTPPQSNSANDFFRCPRRV
ncbi:hypothetical protein LDENG_00044370 [Lucifuga dentata]|nr:hypothetical protein LDENG_00044370 [Lucifuga dentata]